MTHHRPLLLFVVILAAFVVWINAELRSPCYFTRYNCTTQGSLTLDADGAPVIE